jgi:hypothetical protein
MFKSKNPKMEVYCSASLSPSLSRDCSEFLTCLSYKVKTACSHAGSAMCLAGDCKAAEMNIFGFTQSLCFSPTRHVIEVLLIRGVRVWVCFINKDTWTLGCDSPIRVLQQLNMLNIRALNTCEQDKLGWLNRNFPVLKSNNTYHNIPNCYFRYIQDNKEWSSKLSSKYMDCQILYRKYSGYTILDFPSMDSRRCIATALYWLSNQCPSGIFSYTRMLEYVQANTITRQMTEFTRLGYDVVLIEDMDDYLDHYHPIRATLVIKCFAFFGHVYLVLPNKQHLWHDLRRHPKFQRITIMDYAMRRNTLPGVHGDIYDLRTSVWQTVCHPLDIEVGSKLPQNNFAKSWEQPGYIKSSESIRYNPTYVSPTIAKPTIVRDPRHDQSLPYIVELPDRIIFQPSNNKQCIWECLAFFILWSSYGWEGDVAAFLDYIVVKNLYKSGSVTKYTKRLNNFDVYTDCPTTPQDLANYNKLLPRIVKEVQHIVGISVATAAALADRLSGKGLEITTNFSSLNNNPQLALYYLALDGSSDESILNDSSSVLHSRLVLPKFYNHNGFVAGIVVRQCNPLKYGAMPMQWCAREAL